jgi:hypothetical protein
LAGHRAALPTALLYYLASPSAPAGLRDDIVARVNSGERLDAALVREMVLAARKQGRGRTVVKVRASPKEDTVSFSPVEQTTRNGRSSSMKTDRDDPADAHEPVAEQAGGRKALKVEGPQDDRVGPKEDTVSFSPVEQTKRNGRSSSMKTDRDEAVDPAADAAARSLLACFKRTEAMRLLDAIETAGLEQVRQRVKALAAPYD